MEETVEKKNLTTKVALWLVALLLVTLGVIWLVFYTSIFANNRYLIPARNWFDDSVKERLYLYIPSKLPYSLRVRRSYTENDTNMYGYTLMGKLVLMDYVKDIITLQDKDGMIWRFRYKTFTQGDHRGLQYGEWVLDNGTISQPIKQQLSIYDNPDMMEQDFLPGDVMVVFWDEERTLSQILEENRQNDNIIILRGSGGIAVGKVTTQ